MTNPAPVRLDPVRVHAWRLQRQLLAGNGATTPVEVAERLVGVQAQVVSSAALSIALRSAATRRPGAFEATTRALRERQLVRTWAMRSTLHLLAAVDVPTIAAALGREEHWRRPAWLRWFGMEAHELDRLIDTIGEILDDGRPRTRAELAEDVGARLGPGAGRALLGSWGGTLKVASHRHFLVQSSEDEAGVRFVRASRWIGAWREDDERAALGALIVRYLGAYGPASLREVLRWWGMSVLAVVKPIVRELGSALTDVVVGDARALVRTADLDDIESMSAESGAVHLVGGFDPLIVGAGLREQLLPAAHLKRVSRTAGWISPVVLVDGMAAGVWDSRRAGGRLIVTVEPFGGLSTTLRRRIGEAAERVAAAHSASLLVEYGRVFETRGPALRIEPADA